MKAEPNLPRRNILNEWPLAIFRSLPLALAALLGIALTLSSQGQDRSPAGDWDCVISGSRNGLALLTFGSDTNGGFFNGVEVLVPKKIPPAHASLSNAVAGTLGSSAPVGRATQSPGRANLVFYGGFPFSGPWSLDRRGRINGSFLEIAPDRVTCRTNQLALGTNFFEAAGAILETNLFLDTFCVTLPFVTNMVPGSFLNQMICYVNRVPIFTNSFESTNMVTVTNVLANGIFCETVPVQTNANSGTFTNQTTCYMDRVPFSTNILESLTPIIQTNALPNGTCETLPIFTNLVAGTVTNRTICFTNQLNCTGVTNIVNFVAKATPGKRLTLTAKSPLGNFTLRGVPSKPLADLDGRWSGTRKLDGVESFELFDLASLTNFPNSYLVTGAGAGYTYEGFAILSTQKKIAFALTLLAGADYKSTRAVLGPFSSKNLKAKTTGIEAPGAIGALTNRITFEVEKRLSVP